MQATLPPDHLALVIEDALAALERTADDGARAQPDRRAALLYGWASGFVSSRALASRVETDVGLKYLLRGRLWSFQDIRAFRDEERASLEPRYADVLWLCRAAGMARLGEIGLDEPAGSGTEAPGRAVSAAVAYARLATALFSRSSAADEREDRELAAPGRAAGLPADLIGRGKRQVAFREAAAHSGLTAVASQPGPTSTSVSPSPHLPVRRPGRPALLALSLHIAAVLAIVVAGLLLVRWVAWATAIPGAGGQQRARAGLVAPGTSPAAVTRADLDAEGAEIEVAAARDEAMRLAMDALAADQLETARDLYFLALQAVPEDPEASDRLRQVDIALRIDERRGGWEEARSELEDLRAAAPGSPAVLRAYVTALVGSGREALAGRDAPRAFALCDEAVRWLPARGDAQACLAQARPAGAPTATSGPAVVGVPTAPTLAAPRTPGATGTSVTLPTPASGQTQDLPLPSLEDIMPILERLQEQLQRSGPQLVPGTPGPLDGSP